MPSTVATVSPQLVVRESEYQLKNVPTVLRSGIPDYSSKFKGGASGTTVKIAKPTKVSVSDGTWDTSAAPNADREASVDLTMATTPVTVTHSFTPDQLGMLFEDFAEQIQKPSMGALVSKIESKFLTAVVPKISRFVQGAGLTSASVAGLRTVLGDALCPQNNLKAAVRYLMNQDLQQDTEDLYNAASAIGKANLKGSVPNWGGFDIVESTIMPIQTTGTRAASTIGTTVVEGATTILVDVGSGTETVKKGEIFYVALCQDVNAITKDSLGTPKRYVVSADATAVGGIATLTVTEAVYASSSDNRQNVTRLPTAGDTVVWVGAGSASNMQGIFYDPMAFATAFLDFPAYNESNAAPFTVPGTKIKGIFKRQENVATGVTTFRWDVLMASALIEDSFAARFIRSASTT
jgi:hypothetical protein